MPLIVHKEARAVCSGFFCGCSVVCQRGPKQKPTSQGTCFIGPVCLDDSGLALPGENQAIRPRLAKKRSVSEDLPAGPAGDMLIGFSVPSNRTEGP